VEAHVVDVCEQLRHIGVDAAHTLHEATRRGLTIVKVWNIASLIAVTVVRRCRTQKTADRRQHTADRTTQHRVTHAMYAQDIDTLAATHTDSTP
jgi:hypothetical protein